MGLAEQWCVESSRSQSQMPAWKQKRLNCLIKYYEKYKKSDKLTSLVLVTGNIKARRAPLRKFKWIRNMVVTVRLGGAASM